jgi:hypothetical protein
MGGAVDGAGRVAWVETDVARLRVAGGGRILVDRKLNRQDETNWGYEGCSVPYLQWWGDRVVAVSSEERVTAVWSVSVGDECAVHSIPRPWTVAGDLLVWLSQDYPGLLCARALPGLQPQAPLPLRGASKDVRLSCDGDQVVVAPRGKGNAERVRLPSAVQRSRPADAGVFLDRVERDVAPDGGDECTRMLVEAAAAPFCEPEATGPWHEAPLWIPVYWHRHLVATGQAAEAARHLACLDAIAAALGAAEPETGWRREWAPEEGAVALAARYVRRQARLQAQACRARELPRGWWCLLFMPAPGSDVVGSRVDGGALTPALRRAFEVLVATRPEPIPHRY